MAENKNTRTENKENRDANRDPITGRPVLIPSAQELAPLPEEPPE